MGFLYFMSKKTILFLIFINITIAFGCSSTAENSSKKSTNANVVTNIDPKNMPPGLSASPIPPSANTTPGIPDPKTINANMTKGTTPTPGIPDQQTLKKQLTNQMPKGATPTPGIPDPETLRKQMNAAPVNANPIPPTEPSSGDDRPRTVRKP